jgi:hypothetical protein
VSFTCANKLFKFNILYVQIGAALNTPDFEHFSINETSDLMFIKESNSMFLLKEEHKLMRMSLTMLLTTFLDFRLDRRSS